MRPASSSTAVGQFDQERSGAPVDELVDGVEAQRVDVEVLEPLARVGQEVRSHVVGERAVQVDRRTPGRAVAVGEVGSEPVEDIAFGPEVVVDDVQHDGEVASVALVHELLQATLDPPYESLHGKREDPVVAPVTAAGELRDRHDLDRRHAEFDQVVECGHRPCEGALLGERPDVQFVEDPLPQWSGTEFLVSARDTSDRPPERAHARRVVVRARRGPAVRVRRRGRSGREHRDPREQSPGGTRLLLV